MTLLSTLGYAPQKKDFIPVNENINANEISIVIPVKNNQPGISRFLQVFEEVTPKEYYPLEIIIVDNNSDSEINIPDRFPVKLILSKCLPIGPASARNKGIEISKGKWILFTDSDCIPTWKAISGYCKTDNIVIAYAGGIDIVSNDILSNYYKTQETLIPPEAKYAESIRPDYLVTANCLIQKNAIEFVGGFDPAFKQAGGEDIDIAFRLLEVGELDYQFNSITRHEFDDGITGFISRFKRYGRGNKQLAIKYNLNLKPRPFMPLHISFANVFLALLQFLAMRYGYAKGAIK